MPDDPERAPRGETLRLRAHLGRLALFAAASGAGLAIDFLLFLAFIVGGTTPGYANLASGTAAVSFVYFASVRRIFSYRGGFLLGLFAAYLAYQAAGVSLASWAVAALAALQVPPLLAKLMILPITFPANYVFMSLLTARREARA
jgi:putative flippase GtrA